MPETLISRPDQAFIKPEKKAVAYFITPHGFGHAARAAAIMAALHELNPAICFEIYTLVPAWFFQDSLGVGDFFKVHRIKTDIGLIQKSPLEEDLPATLNSLEEFIPFDDGLITELVSEITELECQLILCDIAPLGIAIAHKAGIPSVLIENFTWDWIYKGYSHEYTKFNPIIDYLEETFSSANFHIQTEPVCEPNVNTDLITHPVSRKNRISIREVRQQLSLPAGAKAVLITMGGIQTGYDFISRLQKVQDIFFVIPGFGSTFTHEDNLILLPHHSAFYHPDLVNTCDAVVGKTGYSTVSEVFQAGIPFGFVSRPKFRESLRMAVFVRDHIHGFEISEQNFLRGDWIMQLPELLSYNRVQRNEVNGANQAAKFILELLDHSRL